MHCRTPKNNESIFIPKKRNQCGQTSRIKSNSRRAFAGAGAFVQETKGEHLNRPLISHAEYLSNTSEFSSISFNDCNGRGDCPALLPLVDPSGVNLTNWRHQSTISTFDRCDLINIKSRRRYWRRKVFQISYYSLLAAVSYVLLAGFPLWQGGLVWLYDNMQTKSLVTRGWAIFIGVSTLLDLPDSFSHI